MSELMLINPRRRKRKTAAKRRHNPVRSAKRRTRRKAVARRANPIRRHVRHVTRARRRRNPVAGAKVDLKSMLMPTLQQAAGGLALDFIWQRLGFLPDVVRTGNARYLAKLAAGFGIGLLAHKVGVKSATARNLAQGAMTVTAHDALKSIITNAGIPLAGADDAYVQVGEYVPMNGIGEYVPMNGMGAAMYEDEPSAWEQ